MGEGRKPGEEIGGGNLHHTERTLVTRGQRRSIGVGIMGRQPTFVGRNRRGSERTIVGEEKEAGCVRSSFEEGWGRKDGNGGREGSVVGSATKEKHPGVKKNTGEEKKRGEGQGKRGRGRREKGKGYATGRKTSDDVWTKRRQT